METLMMAWPFLAILAAGYILKYSCDSFEGSAGYLGRNMAPGIKGATVNAVGSSMPELFSVVACLFFFNDPQMFAVGLGITAGSAIFNGCIIPALSILWARDSKGKPVDKIVLDRNSLLRDIFWVLLAEISLVILLGFNDLTIWGAVALNAIYVGYAFHLYWDSRGTPSESDYEEELMDDKGVVGNLLTFNLNGLMFGNSSYTARSALFVLLGSVVVIAAASHLLVEGIVGIPAVVEATTGWVLPNFFVGLVLGAAASSVPDLILSVKDARKGNGMDAVSNPLASNTFDTTISIGLPLLAWLLWTGANGIELTQGEGLTELRMSIIAVTIAVAASLLFKYKAVTRGVAWTLLSIYAGWVAFAVMLMS
jgi:cation:H+ antiporter